MKRGNKKTPPATLGLIGRGLWKRLLDRYEFEGDPALLEVLCQQYDQLDAFRQALAGADLVVKEGARQKPNPLLLAQQRTWTAFRVTWRALGLADLESPVPPPDPKRR